MGKRGGNHAAAASRNCGYCYFFFLAGAFGFL